MVEEIERRTAKVVKARERIARTLMRELGVEQSVAECAAEACVGMAFTEKPKAPERKPVLLPFHRRRARTLVLFAAIVCALLGGKWLFLDQPQRFPTYPREYVVDERWRPTDRDGWPSNDYVDEEGGRCFKGKESPACLHSNLLPEVSAALGRAVESKAEGIVWHGPNGNGELWTIERRRFRFVVRAEKDVEFKR